MEPVSVVRAGNYIGRIYYDTDPTNPREDDHFGRMLCWHNKYKLGDAQPTVSPTWCMHEACTESNSDFPEFIEGLEGEDWDNEVISAFDDDHYSLPLYLYDHSGLTISTCPFDFPWDSGRIGFIYVPKACLFGVSEEEAIERMQAEVDEYDLYLRGESYFFTIELDGEVIDSCGGYLGLGYAIESMTSILNTHNEVTQ